MESNEDKFLDEFEISIHWFCEKISESVPIDRENQDKILERMKNLGWFKQHEIDLYKQLTRPSDDE